MRYTLSPSHLSLAITLALHLLLWWMVCHTRFAIPVPPSSCQGQALTLTMRAALPRSTPHATPAPASRRPKPIVKPQTSSQKTSTTPRVVQKSKLTPQALYTPQAQKQQGAALELEGWAWDSPPAPHDPSNELGRIVIAITVDAHGEVVSTQVLEKTVSSTVAQCYQEALAVLTFCRTDGRRLHGPTHGKVTFWLQAK